METQQMPPASPASLRSALLALIVPIALATGLYAAGGRLWGPEFRVDSETYLDVVDGGVLTAEALRSVRTLGYPLFLAALQSVFGSLDLVPILHWVIFCSAVVFFALALLRIGASRPLTIALTAPLLFCDAVAAYLPVVLTEVPSLALAVASMAAVILATREPGRRIWWVVLAATVLLSYQFRPAFLFLVGIVPVLVWLLDPLVRGRSNHEIPRWRIVTSATAAATVPFLGFCLLRLFVAGHFGLVSFAGTNLVGITGSILNEPMLPEVSPEARPLAEAMLEIRNSSELLAVQRECRASWDQVASRRLGLELPNYDTIDRLYNPTIHQVAIPAAKRVYGDDQVAANRAFSRLSREIVTLRPVTYAAWVALALVKSAATALTLYVMLALMGLCTGAFLLGRIIDAATSGKPGPRHKPMALTQAEWNVFAVVATIAVVFFCAKALLVALVEPTLPRYVRPAAVFLPMIPAMALYCQVRRATIAMHRQEGQDASSSRNLANAA